MKKILPRVAAGMVFSLLLVLTVRSQSVNVVPFAGIGAVQFLDNNGAPLTNGVLYSYQAGTSTQQATYTDSTGTTPNTNPLAFGSGGRAAIWLLTGATYKFVLCSQNDGANCAPGDVLYSIDQVPASSGGSGGGSSPFTGTFISGSGSPATTGILRLASSDAVCFRNSAGSGNLCVSKDSNDVLGWVGALKLSPVGTPGGGAGFSYLWNDATANRFVVSNNGGPTVQLAVSGVDINTSDQVTQLHFGSAATPLSGTAPTTGQYLQWNGTNIIGAPAPESIVTAGANGVFLNSGTCVPTPINGSCTVFILANAHTLTRFTFFLAGAPTGCSVSPVLGVRDITSSTTLTSSTIANSQATGVVDSGALSVAMTAGHSFFVGIITAGGGCGSSGTFNSANANYQ